MSKARGNGPIRAETPRTASPRTAPARSAPARLAGLLAVAAAVLAVAACASVQVSRPEGFAGQPGAGDYRAISPEGMLYRVRTVANEPAKDLAFWSEALRVQLTREGYRMIGQQEQFSGAREGVFYEWGVRYGAEDYIYLTAILVLGDRIAVAEAGGEHTVYRKYREQILESLKSIRIGSR